MSIKKPLILFLLLLCPILAWADVHSDIASPLFGEQNGTNAGRYRSVKFSNGTTTNNADGSISVTTGGGGGGGSPGGATTQVQYNSSGSFAGNAGFVFVAPNVGINTASPGQILDVQGTIRTSQLIDSGVTASQVVVTNANQQLIAASNVQDLAYCQSGGTNCPGSITGFANPSATIGLSANNGSATTAMRSDATPALGVAITPTWTGKHTFNNATTAFVTGAGNVGINTSAPTNLFQINGPSTGFNYDGNNVGIGTYNSNNYQFYLYNNSNTLLAGAMAIKDNRSVGGPEMDFINDGFSHLEMGVTGTAYGFGPANKAFILSDVVPLAIFGGYNNHSTRPSMEFTTDGNVGIGTVYATNANLFTVQGNIGIGTMQGDAYETTSAPLGGMIVYGNVGIGNVAPGQKLDVSGTTRMANIIDSGITGLTQCVHADSSGNFTGTGSDCGGGGGSGTVNSGTTGQAAYYASSTTAVSGTNNLLFKGNNVGIGTSLSANILDVAAGVALGTTYAGYQTAPSNGLAVQGNVGIGTWAPGGSLEIEGGNVGIGTTRLSQSALTVMNGNVGIGTWAPTKMFVVGAAANTAFSVDSAGAVQASSITRLTNTAVNIDNTQFRVNNSGVTISNESNLSGSDLVMYGGKNATSFLLFKPSGVTANGGYIDFQSGNVGVGTLSALHIYDGGNVGIGTMGTGNVGIGTSLIDGKLTIGGNCTAHTGDTACIGITTLGAACLGYCSGGLGGNCTACTCC